MKTLLLSDLHGNLAALEAIAHAERLTARDEVICLGDIVGYGPEPEACRRWIAHHAAIVVQGNHDRALGSGVPPGCRTQFEWLAQATAHIGRGQVDAPGRAWLAALPPRVVAERDGVRYLFVHASPGDPLYEYVGAEPSAWADELASLEATPTDADVVVVGHTHLQFELQVAGRRVLNPGSVGQPKDGNPRAAYAVLEDGAVRFGRVAYPVERTIEGLAAAKVAPPAVEALGALLRTGCVPPVPARPAEAAGQARPGGG